MLTGSRQDKEGWKVVGARVRDGLRACTTPEYELGRVLEYIIIIQTMELTRSRVQFRCMLLLEYSTGVADSFILYP